MSRYYEGLYLGKQAVSGKLLKSSEHKEELMATETTRSEKYSTDSARLYLAFELGKQKT